MRRGTLITIMALFLVLLITAVVQLSIGSGDEKLPGPRTPSATPP